MSGQANRHVSAIDLVLGSTSRYRAALLARITPTFRQLAPEVDESRLPGETPAALAQRLAARKAEAVASRCVDAVVIGSDQVAALDDQILDKPGSAERARAQLMASSGRIVTFHTAIHLIDTRRAGMTAHTALDTTRVQFRQLQPAEIDRYIEREQPLDCAGSFKCEGLGITLFEYIDNRDPTALIGLPLIELCRLLRAGGIDVV